MGVINVFLNNIHDFRQRLDNYFAKVMVFLELPKRFMQVLCI